MPAIDHLGKGQWPAGIPLTQPGTKLQEPPNLPNAPKSELPVDSGDVDIDMRLHAGEVDAALNAAQQQVYARQLGEVEWLGHPALRTVSHYAEIPGAREQPVQTESGAPPTHLFRGMSEDEFQEAQSRGFIRSDERGVLTEGWEGTNAGTSPGTARYYLPHDKPGRIVKIAHHPDDEWFATNTDTYARTRAKIPWERVVAHTESIPSDEERTARSFRSQVVEEQKRRKEAQGG